MSDDGFSSPLIHFEIISANPERSKEFYEKVFKWKFTDQSEGTEVLSEAEKLVGSSSQSIIAGINVPGALSKIPKGAKGPMLNLFFLVDNVAVTLEKVAKMGGKVIFPRTEIPLGFLGMFKDPDGLDIGIIEITKKDRILRVKEALSKGRQAPMGVMYSSDEIALDLMTRKD